MRGTSREAGTASPEDGVSSGEKSSWPRSVVATSRAASTSTTTTIRLTTTPGPMRRRGGAGAGGATAGVPQPGVSPGEPGPGPRPWAAALAAPAAARASAPVTTVWSPHCSGRTPSSAVRSSSAVAKRSSGRRARARITAASSAGGTPTTMSWGGCGSRCEPGQSEGRLVVGPERRLAAERLVEHGPEGVDVGAGVDRAALDLLRGQVLHRAEQLRRAGQVGLVEDLGDAEVGDEDPAVVGQQDVRRLHVAVDDARLVGAREGGGDLGADVHDLDRVEPAPFVEELPAGCGPARAP